MIKCKDVFLGVVCYRPTQCIAKKTNRQQINLSIEVIIAILKVYFNGALEWYWNITP